jgi:serine/threonine protein kinase
MLSPRLRNRFVREARTAAALRHPNIITVYDTGEEGMWCWIAMERCTGPSLSKYLADGPSIAPDSACRLVVSIADAVEYAHAHGMLHRDLKPSNILLEPRIAEPVTLDDYVPKLTDFGLAKWLASDPDDTHTGVRLGTLSYMAPEQVEGRTAEIGPATDVYGLGVLLYQLLTGRLPFTGETDSKVISGLLLDNPPSPRRQRKEVSRALEAIVLKALSKKPAERYPSARAMATDLRRYLTGESTQARPLSLFQRMIKKVRQCPAATLAGVAALAAVGLLIHSDRLSRENHELRGIQTILLETNPSGARVVFVPRDEQTGESLGTKAVRPNHRSPIRQELRPGNYLVVADLGNGRFQENYFEVPRHGSKVIVDGMRKNLLAAADGTLRLGTIKIPPLSVTDGMALVTSTSDPAGGTEQVAPFYMDTHEFTVAEYKRIFPTRSPNRLGKPVNDDDPMCLSYREVLEISDHLGKRPPTEREYAAAMRHCRFTSSGSDRTDTVPPITGLLTGVAEWTSSCAGVYEVVALHFGTVRFRTKVVRAADLVVIENGPRAGDPIRDPALRVEIATHSTKPGLGFRFVRSAKPQF